MTIIQTTVKSALTGTLAFSMAASPAIAFASEDAASLAEREQAADSFGIAENPTDQNDAEASGGSQNNANASDGDTTANTSKPVDSAGSNQSAPGATPEASGDPDFAESIALPESSGNPVSTERDDAQSPNAVESEEPGAQESDSLAEGDVRIDGQSFPDDAFRSWILNPKNLKGIGADGVLTKSERESVTFIGAQRQGIRDATGLSLFPNLTMIDFEGNYLESIDLSGNRELLTVYIRNNILTSVDFSNNTKLEFIETFDNRLTELDVSMLPNLKFLHADYNQLTCIDLSHNTKLEDDGFVGNNNPLEKVILPSIPGRSFDTFVISELNELKGYTSTLPEWYTTPDFQEGTGFTPSIDQGKTFVPFDGQTLYVKRTPNNYSISFDANGGTGEMENVSRTWNDGEQALPANEFNRTGYRFLGWSSDKAAAKPEYSDGQPVQNLAGAKDTGEKKTLYAVWERIEPSEGYFRDQLSETQKAIYDDIASQLDKLTDQTDPSSLEIYVPETEIGKLESILFAVLRDHPEYFWIDFSKLAWEEVAKDRYALCAKVTGEAYFTDGFTNDNIESYRERFETAVDAIVSQAPSDAVLAVRYFNNWLAANNTYNPSGLGASNFSRTAASAILSNNDPATGPVCYGYATAMKVLLDRAGIPNAYIEGTAYNGKNGPSGEQHAWNYVLVDGAWYAVDPTWSDPGASSAGATDTYFLVGSNTVTTPGLAGKETFGLNHDPAKTPASNYGLSYPALSDRAYEGASTGLFEVTGGGTSQKFDSLSEAVAAASDGQTVKLWGDAKLDGTIAIVKNTTIDLNGQSVKCSAGAAFSVADGTTLHLANGATEIGKLSGAYSTSIVNRGSLVIDPGITLKGSQAVSGTPAQTGTHGYASQSSSSFTVYRVVQPENPAPASIDISDLGETPTLADLSSYVNGSGKPAVTLKFILNPSTQTNIPVDGIPAYEWSLVSGPASNDKSGTDGTNEMDFRESDEAANLSTNAEDPNAMIDESAARFDSSQHLSAGTYVFGATVFGYNLEYSIEVSDEAFDDLEASYLGQVDNAQELFEENRGSYTEYDRNAANALFEQARAAVRSAATEDEMKTAIVAMAEAVDAVPTIVERAEGVESSWLKKHAEILSAESASDGLVNVDNAARLFDGAEQALADSEREGLKSFLPDDMDDADKQTVAAAAHALIATNPTRFDWLNDLASASRWVVDASEAFAKELEATKSSDLDSLAALSDSFDGMDSRTQNLVDSSVRTGIEERRAIAQAKHDAMKAIEQARADIDESLYTDEGVRELDDATAAAIERIEESGSIDAIAQAREEGLAALSDVQPAPNPNPDPDPNPAPNPDEGAGDGSANGGGSESTGEDPDRPNGGNGNAGQEASSAGGQNPVSPNASGSETGTGESHRDDAAKLAKTADQTPVLAFGGIGLVAALAFAIARARLRRI